MYHVSRTRLVLLAAAAALVATGAHAAEKNARFTSQVAAVCQLTVGDGLLQPDASLAQLSSENGGGVAAAVEAIANGGNFTLSLTAPTTFSSAPALYVSPTTFTTSMDASGATTATDVDTLALNAGTTNATVDLTADAATGTFPAGFYAAEVVVTCE